MPKIIVPLTANYIDKLYRNKSLIDARDGAQPGLTFRRTISGATWSLQTLDARKRRVRITLGSYPDVTLAQARELAAKARREAQTPPPPEVEPGKTLLELVAAYGEQNSAHLRTWPDQQKRVLHVFASLLQTPAKDLTIAQIQRVVDAHGAKVAAARGLGYLRPILKWGRRREWTSVVSADLEAPRGVVRPRDRVLEAKEVASLVRAVHPYLNHRKGKISPQKHILWLLLLTGCRRSEIELARGEWVTLGGDPVLTIPAESYKTGNETVIPLSPQAVEALHPLPTWGRLFPPVHNWTRIQKALYAETKTSGWHRHDLRRTSATILGSLGFAPHVIDAVLGHKHLGSQIHSTYNKSRYLPEHRKALEALGVYYDNITR